MEQRRLVSDIRASLSDYRSANHTGHQGYKEIVLRQLFPFPDLHCTVEESVGEDDTLVALVTRTGTFKGKLDNIEPTGNWVSLAEVLFYRFADGKLVQTRGYQDRLSSFQQMGVAPPGFELAKKQS